MIGVIWMIVDLHFNQLPENALNRHIKSGCHIWIYTFLIFGLTQQQQQQQQKVLESKKEGRKKNTETISHRRGGYQVVRNFIKVQNTVLGNE